MDSQLQKYYENRQSMVCSDGWRDLMEDLVNMIEARDRLDSVKNGDELQFAKGELSIMRWLKNLEEASNNAYEQLKEEEKNAGL